jgi:sodium transport system ATP-binding protein
MDGIREAAAMMQIENLYKSFKSKSGVVKAVDGVSFVARDGEITGLLGPNGAGKTTTLRMLYTLMSPDRGSVTVDGFDAVNEANDVRRRLGVLPDARGVYKRLTARENIEYFGELHGLDRNTIKMRSDRLISALQMDEFADRQTEGFSQGQRTKTAIARALVHDPKNVILDEPTNGLDVMTTRAMRGFLKQLRSEGRCVLFSSHIMQEVAALCDRIVVIAHGHVVANGTPDELREQFGENNLEDAFVKAIGTEEGLFA